MVLFVHITDFHFKDSTFIATSKVNGLLTTLTNKEPSKIIFLIGGDVTYSGFKKEYDKFGEFLKIIKKKIGNIDSEFYYVPGNHDIQYEDKFRRNRDDIILINDHLFEKSLHIEIARLRDYNEFASTVKYEKINPLLNKVRLEFSNSKIDLYLLNNSLFGYFEPSKKKYDNDKGTMHLPYKYISDIKRDNQTNVFLLMHYPIEYLNQFSYEKMTQSIVGDVDLLLCGHTHFDIQSSIDEGVHQVKVISSGAFNNNNNSLSEYTLLSYDDNEHIVEIEKYKWSEKLKLYITYQNLKEILNLKNYSFNNLKLDESYFKSVFKDILEISNTYLDYYIFPQLSLTKEFYIDELMENYIQNFEDFYKYFEKYELIQFYGGELEGKTSLLFYLHKALSKKYIVVSFESSDINKLNSIDTLVKRAVETQYVITNSEQFKQINRQNKVAIIDDFDYVDDKPKIISKLLKIFSKIIVTRNKTVIEEIAELTEIEDLSNFSYVDFEIANILKIKRDELLRKIYTLLCDKTDKIFTENNFEKYMNQFNNILDMNFSLFGQTPFAIAMLAKYIYNFDVGESKNIYNDVFTSNLLLQINQAGQKIRIKNCDPYTTCLQKLAYSMNKSQKSLVDEAYICNIVDQYNKQYRQSITMQNLLSLLINGHIFKKSKNKYGFVSNNYFSFFVSREFVSMANDWEKHKTEFNKLIDNIFYGNNDKILLFLAFAQQNQRIIKEILKTTQRKLKDKKQLDFNQFPLLTDSKDEIDTLSLPDSRMKMNRNKDIEKIENEKIRKEKKEIFDIFNKKSISIYEKEVINILRYMKLVSTILPNFSHNMIADLQDDYAKTIFIIPNILLYELFHKLNEERTEFIDLLYNEMIEKVEKSKNGDATDTKKIVITKEQLYNRVVDFIRAYILAVYDMSAKISINPGSIKTIINDDRINLKNHKIEKLMFLSYDTSNRDAFMKYAIELNDADKKDIITRNCVKLIVRRYALSFENSFVTQKNINFLRKFFDEKSIKRILAVKSNLIAYKSS